MDRTGMVVALEKSKAIVEINRGSSCGEHCASCSSGCETNVIRLTVENTMDAKLGDVVIVEAEDRALLRTTFILYTIPLVTFVAGIGVGYAGGQALGMDAELIGILTGVLTMALTFLTIQKLGKGTKEIIQLKQIIK